MAVDIVSECKTRLGITGEYHDALLLAYAEDARAFLLSAGVPQEVAYGEDAVGCIARGVADLWNLGAGDGKLSSVFMQRAIQLATVSREGSE